MLARSALERGRTADRQLELLSTGWAAGGRIPHRLRDGSEVQVRVESQRDAVRGEILTDRAVVFIVQRRVPVRLVLVAGVPMFGVLPAGGRMIVVMAVPVMPVRRRAGRPAIGCCSHTVVQRVSVAMMMSADGVQTGVPQARDRSI